MRLKRRAEAPLSPSAWTALLRFKGPTGITSQESAGGMKEGFLGCHRPVCTLKQQTGRERDKASSLPIMQALLFNPAIHFHALITTRCNVNDYLLCTDLYQVKNHSNLNLICLHNKWFVYTELDALPQLLKISLTDKSLVRPCLGKSEKASPPHVPLCITIQTAQSLYWVYQQKEMIFLWFSHFWIHLKIWLQVLFLLVLL